PVQQLIGGVVVPHAVLLEFLELLSDKPEAEAFDQRTRRGVCRKMAHADLVELEFPKSEPQHASASFGHDAQSPMRAAEPIRQLRLVVGQRSMRANESDEADDSAECAVLPDGPGDACPGATPGDFMLEKPEGLGSVRVR